MCGWPIPFGHARLAPAAADPFHGLGKIAALGIKVSRHCSYHGVALNVAMDLEPFTRIDPCGYAGLQTVDLRTLGVATDVETRRGAPGGRAGQTTGLSGRGRRGAGVLRRLARAGLVLLGGAAGAKGNAAEAPGEPPPGLQATLSTSPMGVPLLVTSSWKQGDRMHGEVHALLAQPFDCAWPHG